MKVSEIKNSEKLEHLRYIVVQSKVPKGNGVLKLYDVYEDNKVDYDLEKINAVLNRYLNNECVFNEVWHSEYYSDGGNGSWSFLELIIYK